MGKNQIQKGTAVAKPSELVCRTGRTSGTGRTGRTSGSSRTSECWFGRKSWGTVELRMNPVPKWMRNPVLKWEVALRLTTNESWVVTQVAAAAGEP